MYLMISAARSSSMPIIPDGGREGREGIGTCPTMPWSICTSLVILWGVCWMFHRPSPPLSSWTASRAVGDLESYSLDEFLFVSPQLFDPEIDFHLPPEQLSLDNNELGEEETKSFGPPFAIGGDTPVQAQDAANTVTSDHQQQDVSPPSLQLLLNHTTALGFPPAASETPPQGEQPSVIIRCTELGCQSTFGGERELHRHQQSIHSGLQFACTVAGCKRGSQKPFNRPDNLQRHMQRVHGQDSPVQTVSNPESSRQAEKRQADTVAHLSPVPEDKRRRMGDSLAHTDAQGSSELMVDQSEELARLQRQLEDAVAENQSLKDEVRSLKERIKKRDEYVKDLLTNTD